MEQENDRVALKRQESIDSGVPMDGTKNPRCQQKKIRKTTFCDTRRNLLKICLAICMTSALALLVVLIVRNLGTLCKEQTDFYEEDLLCIKCNTFYPSSDLTPHTQFGSVKVFNVRAAGLFCCVETVDEIDRLMQLVQPQQNQRRISERNITYYTIEKPIAHLFLDESKSAKPGDFLPWSVHGGSGTAFVAGGVTYSLQDGKLKVPTSGHYYVYSHVTFRQKEPDLANMTVSLYHHYILRSNPSLANGGEEELISDEQTNEKNGSILLLSSNIGAILELRKDDQLIVRVSEIASVFWVAKENFFGLHKI